MDASHGTATLSHEKKRSRHGKRSTGRRKGAVMTDCAWGKPGDVNEDGREIEQDGWITVSEIQIPVTETDEDDGE